MTATNPLPINTTGEPCWRCWTPPGKTHELSCDEVTLAQTNAYWAWRDDQRVRQDRRDRMYRQACAWLLAVVLLLVVALIWGWAR